MDKRNKSSAQQNAEALKRKKSGAWEHWHWIMLLLLGYDIAVTNGAYLFALWIRFDCTFSRIESQYLVAWQKFVPIYTACCLVVFWVLHLYQSIWRFASYNEFKHILIANVITALFHTAVITIAFERMPISYYVIGMGVQFLLTMAIRLGYRFVLLERRRLGDSRNSTASRVMMIGAGVLPADYDFEAHKELVPMQPGDVPVTYADTTPLERDFGFRPNTPLREGLRKFARWYKEFYEV